MNWDELIVQASNLIESREKYQRVLGKIAHDIANEYGFDKLNDFSRDLQETYGLSISPSTLKNYKWVHEKVSKLKLPEDLSYRTLQFIASSGRPKYWAKRIRKEGLSSPQVYRLLREEKGLDKKVRKTVICSQCGYEVEI